MKKMIAFLSLLAISSTAFSDSGHQSFLLCTVTGMNDIAYKIEYKDIENGSQCPIVLPTKLVDYEFRVSRHTNSDNLRVIIENKKTLVKVTALGGNNEASLKSSLSEVDGASVAKQLGFNDSHIYEELSISCNPNFGMQSEYYKPIEGNNDCYGK